MWPDRLESTATATAMRIMALLPRAAFLSGTTLPLAALPTG
jgi:hypothetical protein